HEASDVHALGIGFRLGGDTGSDGGNFAIFDDDIGNGVEMVGGVHDSSACEDQRIHREGTIHGGTASSSSGLTLALWAGGEMAAELTMFAWELVLFPVRV